MLLLVHGSTVITFSNPTHGCTLFALVLRVSSGLLNGDVCFKLQENKVQCQQISVGHGQEVVIDDALATAVRTDTWLVIENLQLASRLWLEQLYNRLSRLQLQAGKY